MKISFVFNVFKIFILSAFLFNNNYNFAQSTNLQQDPRFEQLLKEKQKINSGLVQNNRYKIQIYSGNNELAKKTLVDFRKEFKTYDATITFSSPIYKVWIGNYKNRIEAERNLRIISKKYPNALIIKPSR
jgi:hypothetical protein